jgi:hypothetical protein
VLGPWRGLGFVGPAAPQVDHRFAIDVDGERGAEVFARIELGIEQLTQGFELRNAAPSTHDTLP